MKDVPYDKWRVNDPDDSVRFYALRLREAGMIKSTPQHLIADGTNWRSLNELKKELKGSQDRPPPRLDRSRREREGEGP